MSKEMMRAFDFEGKSWSLRLDEGTWQAIDWLAATRKVNWSELAREWVTRGCHGPQTDDKLTRAVRSAAMDALYETMFVEQFNSTPRTPGPIWESLGMCDERDYGEALANAKVIEAYDDFGGFVITTGVSEQGNVTYYIQNNFRDGLNLIISTPVPYQEWAERMKG